MNRLNRLLPIGMIVILGFLLGNLFFSGFDKPPSVLQKINWKPETQWMAASKPSYQIYARHTFYLPSSIQASWLRISADNDFTLYVNGKKVVRESSIFDNSLGFKNGLEDDSQAFNDSNYYKVKINRYSLMLANFSNWKVATYVDLNSYLVSGKNVLALEIQKGQKNPRFLLEGYVYTVPKLSPIVLTTGVTHWKVSTLLENRQDLRWFDPDFQDQSWSEAKTEGSVKADVFSRLSKNLYDLPLQGSQISGNVISNLGETWLRGVWHVSRSQQRSFIRFASNNEYDLLLNGHFVNHLNANSNQLNMYEVTHLLHSGNNYLAVHLSRSLTSTNKEKKDSPETVQFFLDGWTETSQGEILEVFSSNGNWQSLSEPILGWAEGRGESLVVNVVGEPNRNLKRIFGGNAYLLDFPNYLLHAFLWSGIGIAFSIIAAFGLGICLCGNKKHSKWDSLASGAVLLSPGTFFLIGLGLLKHRYAESEVGLLFAQTYSTPLILLGFVSVVSVTLLCMTLQSSQKEHIECQDIDEDRYSIMSATPDAPVLSPPKSFLWKWSILFLLGMILFVSIGALLEGDALIICLIFSGFFGGLVTVAWRWANTTRLERKSLTPKAIYTSLSQSFPDWNQWLWLGLIIGVGFMFRLYNLGGLDVTWDEGISMDAARGILRTGEPIATSGVWYSRSPFYHYMLAIWLRIVGDVAFNARLLNVAWGSAMLILVYMFAKDLTGKIWIALFITAILAIDPFLLWYSRFIRFYQVVQVMTLLTFWFFIKGFIDKSGKKYQYGFFISATLMLLNQELNVTFIPCFLIGFLYFYRPFRLFKEWQIILGSFMLLGVYSFNAFVFVTKTLTPLVAQSSRTVSQIRLHLSDVSGFLSILFAGSSRMSVIYAMFFILSFAYFLKQRNGKLVFLYSSILINIVLLTILAFDITPRYLYSNYWLFVTVTIYGAICITESLGTKLDSVLRIIIPFKKLALFSTLILLLCNLEVSRVLESYKEEVNVQNDEVFAYIKNNLQLGDIVISNYPPAALTSSVKLDYNLSKITDTDFADLYLENGLVVNRGAGSIAITNLDQMPRILSNANRVWIHQEQFLEERLPASFVNYFQTLGKIVMQPFGSRLRLWQPQDGIPRSLPNEGKDVGSY
ncbi:glycosyltransferase family 39 protein [Tumidithrix elongata RA019]|uniref:Glycosyltransferase family 39 protein n=1 Tax=Tumidithrix elongata BACA0141 TaxID=2716417 RepID=A0AAW9PYD7_9CYAN|nr:glycosyltransferase family 39 protein [Tumidithrix elongata RA019]